MADQKFQLRYSATEDRVLIISGTGPGDMRCFALTRRMIGQLWPGLNRVIATIAPRIRDLQATPPADGAASGMPAATLAATQAPQPQNAPSPAHSAADRPTPPSPAPVRRDAPGENPFGDPPPREERHLVRKLQLAEHGGMRMLLLAGQDVELRVPLDNAQLLQVYDALRLVIERADWAIDLDAGLPTADSAADSGAEPAPAIDISAESPSRYRH